MRFSDVMRSAPRNEAIRAMFEKAWGIIDSHEMIFAGISGGADSDLLMDLIVRCGGKEKTVFGFFNTGLEYDATKRQLAFLAQKYGVFIDVIPPIMPIPKCVKEYGVPFWSKYVSEMISRLQRHGFKWEDKSLDVLLKEYPKCRAALRWWCNDHPKRENGAESSFNIAYVRGLKEFMIANHPSFRISAKCCHYAKKEPAKKFIANGDFDLNCTGVRKAEGGARASAYGSCYSSAMAGPDQYRPLFWLTGTDKSAYDEHFGIIHSDCYKMWGMKRTGCAGCPFGKDFEEELSLAEKYEPKMHKAMLAIFGKSYEYTRAFEAFRRELRGRV